MRSRLLIGTVLSSLALATTAHAGATHVVEARTFSPVADTPTIAISADDVRSEASYKALAEGLTEAGFRVVPATAHPALIASVRFGVRPICSQACSQVTGHDEAVLADYYTRSAIVAARPAGASAETPVAWYATLQSDGLSDREQDYLPSMLRAGGEAYGRTVEPNYALIRAIAHRDEHDGAFTTGRLDPALRIGVGP